MLERLVGRDDGKTSLKLDISDVAMAVVYQNVCASIEILSWGMHINVSNG